ncbi:hypothetical protein BDA96_03G246000 [Sorghum bicolor]|uniref:Uncharacterized protein n=1 Tax=Sorghum bicolor TaxID=4558 RepID=A0A921RFX9_SORBI|nr:hypothetical protein BDA96_03G246000 [Sorghum bicolor]
MPPRRRRRPRRRLAPVPALALLLDDVPRRHRRQEVLQKRRVGVDGAATRDGPGSARAVHRDVYERRAAAAAAAAVRTGAAAVDDDLGALVGAGRAEVRGWRCFRFPRVGGVGVGLGEADEGRRAARAGGGGSGGRGVGGAGGAREDPRQPLLQPAAGALPAVGRALVHEGRVHCS